MADNTCNGKKRDRLPACEHLEKWVGRNSMYGGQIADALQERGIVAELDASNLVTVLGLRAVGSRKWVELVEGG